MAPPRARLGASVNGEIAMSARVLLLSAAVAVAAVALWFALNNLAADPPSDAPSLLKRSDADPPYSAAELLAFDGANDSPIFVAILGRVFDGARLAAKSMDGAPVQKRRKEFAAVSSDLNSIFFEQPFRVPDYFALVTRALIVLEGIALSGDPSFDIFKAAYPHGLRRARELFGVEGLARIAAAAGRARVARAPVDGTEATPIARRLTTV